MKSKAATTLIPDNPFTAPYPVAVCDVERGRFSAGPRALPSDARGGARGLVGWFAGRMVDGRRNAIVN